MSVSSTKTIENIVHQRHCFEIKTSTMGKAVGLIPGIGNALGSMSNVILGSGTLIKNSIGMAAMIAIIVVSNRSCEKKLQEEIIS